MTGEREAGSILQIYFLMWCSSGIIASVITMKRYKARFTDDANIEGAVVSTFNGKSTDIDGMGLP